MKIDLEYYKEQNFRKSFLRNVDFLFEQRAALFLTDTKRIPETFIGSGDLSIYIDLPIPNHISVMGISAYRSPRFWVDQIQRTTNKIRWSPTNQAKIEIIGYNCLLPDISYIIGTKSLIDSLKFKSTGRNDGKDIYYFGAIIDDSDKYIKIIRKYRTSKGRNGFFLNIKCA